jgi:hypothetical protein
VPREGEREYDDIPGTVVFDGEELTDIRADLNRARTRIGMAWREHGIFSRQGLANRRRFEQPIVRLPWTRAGRALRRSLKRDAMTVTPTNWVPGAPQIPAVPPSPHPRNIPPQPNDPPSNSPPGP